MSYELLIDETSRRNLKDAPVLFNQIRKEFKSLEEVKAFLIERYNKLPRNGYDVFIDGEDGKPVKVGFTYSFWQDYYPYDGKKYYQTDWIVIYKIERKPIDWREWK